MEIVLTLLFWAVLITAFFLVICFGSGSAKAFILVLVAATVATGLIQSQGQASFAPLGYFAVDALVLAAGCYFLVRSAVFWPVWFCGFQLISVASQLTRLIMPAAVPAMYANVAGFWAVPALVVMAIGVCRDRAAGLT